MKDNINRVTLDFLNTRDISPFATSGTTSGSVMMRAAAHLNDANQLVYTSEILLPFLQMALDELDEELAVHELSVFKRASAVIYVPIGSDELPQMPVDFIEAIYLYERPYGSSQDWIPVHEYASVNKNLEHSTSITQWAVRGDRIEVNPSQQEREVILDYIRGTTEAVDEDVVIDIQTSRRLLALLTARNAARDLGNAPTKASTYEMDIGRARDRLIRRMQKNAQGTMGVRRRPYRGRR